ncbi:hypothetical protein D9M71_814720 [compost metagenome]
MRQAADEGDGYRFELQALAGVQGQHLHTVLNQRCLRVLLRQQAGRDAGALQVVADLHAVGVGAHQHGQLPPAVQAGAALAQEGGHRGEFGGLVGALAPQR